jgi:hypothetical protein
LLKQGRGPEVIEVVTKMINNYTFPSAFKEADHAKKIIEALEALKNVTGKDQRFNELVQTAKNKYKMLEDRLNSL